MRTGNGRSYVTLTITDDRGNTITLQSGEGGQPRLAVKLYTCS